MVNLETFMVKMEVFMFLDETFMVKNERFISCLENNIYFSNNHGIILSNLYFCDLRY